MNLTIKLYFIQFRSFSLGKYYSRRKIPTRKYQRVKFGRADYEKYGRYGGKNSVRDLRAKYDL